MTEVFCKNPECGKYIGEKGFIPYQKIYCNELCRNRASKLRTGLFKVLWVTQDEYNSIMEKRKQK